MVIMDEFLEIEHARGGSNIRKLQTIIGRGEKFVKTHGADIFSVLACIGVIATGVAAYNSGRNERIEAEDNDDKQTNSKNNVYTPVLCAAGTIGCIGAARYFGHLREQSLLAAGTVLSAYYSKRAESDKESEICGRGYVDACDIEETGLGDIIFVEKFTGRKFKSSLKDVEDAIKELNDIFQEKNFVSLNDFYHLLVIHSTDAGDVLGWAVNQTILDPYLNEDDYLEMKLALTDLQIFIKYQEGIGYVIHYPYIPIGGLAGIGPCNQ